MKKLVIFILAIAFVMMLGAGMAAAAQYPEKVGMINDFENILNADQKSSLEKELTDFRDKTGMVMVAVTVKSFDGQTSEDYAKGIGAQWKVGQKDLNNGVVFLISQTQRKVYICLASGVNNSKNTEAMQSVINDTIKPLAKNNDFAQATIKGVEGVIAYFTPAKAAAIPSVMPSAVAPVTTQNTIQEDQQPTWLIIFGFAILVAVVVFVFYHLIRRYKIRTQLPSLLEQTESDLNDLKDRGLFSTRAQQSLDEAEDNFRRAKIMHENSNTNFMQTYLLLNLINQNIADSHEYEDNFGSNHSQQMHNENNGSGFGGFGGNGNGGLGHGGGGFAMGGGGREIGHHNHDSFEISNHTMEPHHNSGFGGFGNRDSDSSGLGHGGGGFAMGGGGRSGHHNSNDDDYTPPPSYDPPSYDPPSYDPPSSFDGGGFSDGGGAGGDL